MNDFPVPHKLIFHKKIFSLNFLRLNVFKKYYDNTIFIVYILILKKLTLSQKLFFK